VAVQTWSQRAVRELFPKYVLQRFEGFRGRDEAIAREAGISVASVSFDRFGSLAYAPLIAKDGVVSVSRYRWRTPYTTKDPWTPVWKELVAAGIAERSRDGWTLTERGRVLCERLHREARSYLESLDLPQAELRRLTIAVTSLAEGIPPDAERAMGARHGLPLQDEIRSDIARADRALSELEHFRDDSHIASWQAAGYSAQALDVLSAVWEGMTSLDAVASELHRRQDRGRVEREVDALVRRADIERDGDRLALTPRGRASRDAIERETDRRYFQDWPDGDKLARIGDDLTAVIAALPS